MDANNDAWVTEPAGKWAEIRRHVRRITICELVGMSGVEMVAGYCKSGLGGSAARHGEEHREPPPAREKKVVKVVPAGI